MFREFKEFCQIIPFRFNSIYLNTFWSRTKDVYLHMYLKSVFHYRRLLSVLFQSNLITIKWFIRFSLTLHTTVRAPYNDFISSNNVSVPKSYHFDRPIACLMTTSRCVYMHRTRGLIQIQFQIEQLNSISCSNHKCKRRTFFGIKSPLNDHKIA